MRKAVTLAMLRVKLHLIQINLSKEMWLQEPIPQSKEVILFLLKNETWVSFFFLLITN